MKLDELHMDVLWEGEIDGVLHQFIIQEGMARFAQPSKGGVMRGIAGTIVKNPVLAMAAAGYAYDAFQKYKRNKRTTTTFFAKDMPERKLYQKIVDDLMKTGHYKKVREKHEAGGYLWVLQRV